MILDIKAKPFQAPAIIIPKRPSLDGLPNVKELFLPDAGWIFGDADLQQADAQVVAWEAGDASLKQIFLDPNLDLHTENAKTIFGSCPSKKHPNRKKAKKGVHSVNYNVSAKTLAKTLGCSVEEAQHFIDVWFKAHPLVKEWHRRIFNEMKGRKYIENRFGGRKQFYDTTDHGTALSEALAWIPQSTVAIVINKVWDYITDNADPRILRVCMQVHDSLCFNIKLGHLEEALYIIKKAFDSVVVPYDDPLVIGSSMAVGANWGHVEDISWDGYLIDDDTGHVTNERCIYMKAA